MNTAKAILRAVWGRSWAAWWRSGDAPGSCCAYHAERARRVWPRAW